MHNKGKIKTMIISRKWTLINFTLSVIGSVSGYLAFEFGVAPRGRFEYTHLTGILPTFVPAAICLAILFFSKNFCSSCCKVNLPVVYKTGVDINDFSHIIDLQTGLEYGTTENNSTVSNAHQLKPIAPSEVEIGL